MSADKGEWIVIEGRHPVVEALESGVKAREVILSEGVRREAASRFEQLAKSRGVPVRRVPRAEFDKVTRSSAPQGVAAVVRPVEYTPLEQMVAANRNKPGLLLVCDGLEDPHNLGALIRTAEGAGAGGVVIPKRRAVGVTETVVKASAGAVWRMPVAQVTNVTRALQLMQEQGYWVTGAALKGDLPLWNVDFKRDTAIVIGAEGKGLSRLVADSCDYLATIPMLGRINSLNASVAGGLFLFEVVRQRTLQ